MMNLAICTLFFLVVLLREYTMLSERREWASERSLLLNRVQAPDRLPLGQNADFVVPEVEPDEFDFVGVIHDRFEEV